MVSLLHIFLVCGILNCWMPEYIPRLDVLTAPRLDIREGPAHPPDTPGLGIDRDRTKISAQTVAGSH